MLLTNAMTSTSTVVYKSTNVLAVHKYLLKSYITTDEPLHSRQSISGYHISTFLSHRFNLHLPKNIDEKNLYDIINVSFQCMNNIREHHVFNNESKYSMGHSKRYLLEDGPFSSSIAHSGLCRAHSRSYNTRCVQDDGSP